MTPNKIIVHCSASPNGKRVDISEIEKWHKARGFKSVGYHLVIQPDGEVQKGRGLNEIGAHCEGANADSIGICLVGNDKFTKQQFQALEKQLDALLLTFQTIKHYAIYCHYQFPSAQAQKKACPNMEINRLLVWYHLKEDGAIKPYLHSETK